MHYTTSLLKIFFVLDKNIIAIIKYTNTIPSVMNMFVTFIWYNAAGKFIKRSITPTHRGGSILV